MSGSIQYRKTTQNGFIATYLGDNQVSYMGNVLRCRGGYENIQLLDEVVIVVVAGTPYIVCRA